MASAMGAGVLMLASLWATPAAALKLGSTNVAGIGGEARTNVMSRLSLSHHPAEQELTEARLAYLLRRAPGEVLTALEPFGFYDAQVEIESPRDGDTVNVRILVRPGRPVQVNQRDIVVEGPAADDKVVQGDVKAFRPGPREILDHRTYEASKAALERRLNGRGYFDAEPLHKLPAIDSIQTGQADGGFSAALRTVELLCASRTTEHWAALGAAVSGSALSTWAQSTSRGTNYGHAWARIRQALRRPNVVLRGIVWYQGESDTGDETLVNTYATRAQTLFDAWRSDLAMPDLPSSTSSYS